MDDKQTAKQIAEEFRNGGGTEEEYNHMHDTKIEAPFMTHYGAPHIVNVRGHWFLSIEPDAGYANMLPVSKEFVDAWIVEFSEKEAN